MCTPVLVVIVILVSGGAQMQQEQQCDQEKGIHVDEGNIGFSSDFNWLGLLQVSLRDIAGEARAATGVILIKLKYVIANADAIVRIPRSVFLNDTRVMFISAGDTPVYYSPRSYVTHPEYGLATSNTIVIIELNIGDDSPLIPVCFPTNTYDTNELYNIGYTDENQILEKIIYKMKDIPKLECDIFYDSEGLSKKDRDPVSYSCGVWHNASRPCVWDSGMAFVCNSTGWFQLVGLSVYGPGCGAPARFIDLQNYSDWIQSVTRTEEDYDEEVGPRRLNYLDMEFVPIHTTFVGQSRRRLGSRDTAGYRTWPFTDELGNEVFTITPSSRDPGVILIFPFKTTQEMYDKACSKMKRLMYREYFDLRAPGAATGIVIYKLSPYDIKNVTCPCITLSIQCEENDLAILAFKEVKRSLDPNMTSALPPNCHQPNKMDSFRCIKMNYDLYIKFTFKTPAVMRFQLFGLPEHHVTFENKSREENIKKTEHKTRETTEEKDEYKTEELLDIPDSAELQFKHILPQTETVMYTSRPQYIEDTTSRIDTMDYDNGNMPSCERRSVDNPGSMVGKQNAITYPAARHGEADHQLAVRDATGVINQTVGAVLCFEPNVALFTMTVLASIIMVL